jgi:UDP-GlcNAc:undecaprenyl-phosphate GlcNAc-1-phosphate transferase
MKSSIAAPFALALMLSLVFVPLARAIARRVGFVAKPRPDRWHQKPIAMFGGAAIAASLFISILVFHIQKDIAILGGAAAAMCLVGLVDDIVSMKPATKLIAQIAGASILLFFDYRLNWLHSYTLDLLLTLVWVVGMTNAFNLLDNMDGLCGGIAVIVGCSLLIGLLPGAGTSPQTFAQARYLAMLLGAASGFLVYNVHPASIFMGDAGSFLLGFSFAALTLSTERTIATRTDVLSIVAAPVLVLLMPIFDTTLVTVSRWFWGRRASQGGRDHSSHRLVAIGLSERAAVALLWLLAAIGGAIGIVLDFKSQSWTAAAAGLAFVVAMALFAVYLAGIRVYEDDDTKPDRRAVTPLVVNFVHRRRVAEVILDSALVSLCYYAAYRLRFDGDPHEFARNFTDFYRSLPIVVTVQMVAFFAAGVYRGMWRHFGLIDSLTVARGVFIGVVCAPLLLTYIRYFQFLAYSRAVFAIYSVLLLVAVSLSRASFRLVGEFLQRQRRSGTRVVIYGAGDGGGLVISELLREGRENRLVGFIDDDPRKAGIRVMGYSVLGGFSALTVLVHSNSVDAIVVSARNMPAERLNNLTTLCSERGVKLSRLRVRLEPLVEAEMTEERKPSRPATIHQIKT